MVPLASMESAPGPNSRAITAALRACDTGEMERLSRSVQPYDPSRGVVADVEGGSIVVDLGAVEVAIIGDAAGLRDLARWCLAMSDAAAPDGSHVHLSPRVTPLAARSLPLRVERSDAMRDEP